MVRPGDTVTCVKNELDCYMMYGDWNGYGFMTSHIISKNMSALVLATGISLYDDERPNGSGVWTLLLLASGSIVYVIGARGLTANQ